MQDRKYVIADNVRICRKKEHLTQMELAERAQMSLDTIKRIESGKTSMSLQNFLKLADALRVSLPRLLYEKKENVPEMELISSVLDNRSTEQRMYLLHMLQEMARGLDDLS